MSCLVKCVRCGFEWKFKKNKYPYKCANRKCQSILWDGSREKRNDFQAINAKKTTNSMIGRKFNKLTVVRHLDRRIGYLCECECGNDTIAKSNQLKSGRHASCGCIPRKLKPDHLSAKKSILRNYRSAAKRRGYPFQIDNDYFMDLLVKPCEYCSAPASIGSHLKRHSEFKYNGIDRVNNIIGYTNDNCVACCKHCNRSKHSMDLDEWHDWILRLSKSEWANKHEAKFNS